MALSSAGAVGLTLSGWTPALASTPKRGGTLRCGIERLMNGMDPHRFAQGYGLAQAGLCWEGLTKPTSLAERRRIAKEKGVEAVPDVQPMLAESWEVEKNGARYVFHLKKGVKFHNGKELDSADIEWNWKRILDPVHKSGNRLRLGPYLKTIETPDRYTVVANLKRRNSAFLLATIWHNACVIPKESIPWGVVWGQTPTFKPKEVAPPGTGPFKTVEYSNRVQAVLERFDGFHEQGLPYLDKIIFKVIGQAQPRTMALRAGNLDYVYLPDVPWLKSVTAGKELDRPIHLKNDGLVVWPFQSGFTYVFYMNMHPEKDTPFKDVRVRQALDLCLDRDVIAKAIMGHLGEPMGQGFHPDLFTWGYDDIKPKKPDIEKAKKLLKEAGYPNGLDVDFMLVSGRGGSDKLGQIAQQMAKPAGIRIKLNPLKGVQVSHKTRTWDYDMRFGGCCRLDPSDDYYRRFHTDKRKKNPKGYSFMHGLLDPKLDKMLDDVVAEVDTKKKRALFRKVVDYTNENSHIIFIYTDHWAAAWTDKLRNYKPWEYGYLQREIGLKEAWLES